MTELNLTNGADSATLVTWQVKYGRGWLNSHKTVLLAAFLLTYAVSLDDWITLGS
jgi:hypothetical protein